MWHGMATEKNAQHEQHAQLLASLATEHFMQQAVVNQDGHPVDFQLVDQNPSIIDTSRQTVVRLIAEQVTPASIQPSAASPFNLRKKRKIDRDVSPRHEEYKLIPSKDRNSTKNFDMRRPVRPIDRQKMRPWLKNLLDTGSVFGLNWLQRDDGIFQISWRHASRLGWNLETDGDVFERWARHTGIFKDGDDPEPKRWKANFRCALHSLPDVKELTSPTDRKGRNASRTYRFLRANEVQPPVKRKQRYNIQIPYGVFECQASEDSGSQHAESDERNTDEELYTEQLRSFPHCDHDYAIRSEKPDEEQRTSDILTQHNSGYELIELKDTHELEFRLKPQEGILLPPKSPPPAKANVGKKKTLSGGSFIKKAKAKAGQKKEGKRVKKMKTSGNRETSPATKVSLKALLSGRRNPAARKAKSASGVGNRKVKGGKKGGSATGKGKRKRERSGSRASTPTQSQGLQALLEAASQIDRMDAQTKPRASSSANAKSGSKRQSASGSVVSAVSPKVVPTDHVTATCPITNAHTTIPTLHSSSACDTLPVPDSETLSLTLLSASGTLETYTHSFMSSVPASTCVQPQTSQSMLNTFLGLPALNTTSVSSVDLTAADSVSPTLSDRITDVQVQPVTVSSQIVKGIRSEEIFANKSMGNVVAASAVPLLMAQPEGGMSMLKHLLRLTGPSVTTSAESTAIPKIIPSALQEVTTPLFVLKPASGMEANVAETPINIPVHCVGKTGKKWMTEAGAVALHQILQNTGQVANSDKQGSSEEKRWLEVKSFPYSHVSSSDICIKLERSESEETMSGGSDTGGDNPSVSQVHKPVDADTLGCSSVLQAGVGSSVSVPSHDSITNVAIHALHIPVTQTGVEATHIAVTKPHCSSSTPQVTLRLPQMMGELQMQQPSCSMTVTLPHASVPVCQGEAASTSTYTQSMDLMQFLNLFAASGSSQVIIKTETPFPTDMVAMSNAYRQEQNALASQTEDDASVASKFILVDASLQEPATVSAASKSHHLLTPDGQIMSLCNPSLPAAVNSPVLSAVVADSTLATTLNSSPNACEQIMQTSQEMMQVEVSSANVEVVPNQYTCIMNEADISSLSEEQQGADSFVVQNIL